MVNNRGKSWSDTDHAQLKHMFEQGASIEGISKTLGRTPYAVIAKLEKQGALVAIGRYYHKVDPDPWTSWQAVRLATEDFENAANKEA